MATFKVNYGSVSRRFTIGADTTWSNLESQFRSLFQIPPNTQLFATYIDEDGDNVALSSDLELEEVITQCSAGTPIKITLRIKSSVDETAAALEQICLEDDESFEAVLHSQSEPEETEEQVTCEEACEEVIYSADEVQEEQQGHTDYSSSDPEIFFFVAPKRSHHGPRSYSGSAKLEPFGGPSPCPFSKHSRGPHGKGYTRIHRVHKHGEPVHHHHHHHHRGHGLRASKHPHKMHKHGLKHEHERMEDKCGKGPEMNESGPSVREDHHHGQHMYDNRPHFHHHHHRKGDKKARSNSSCDERRKQHYGFGRIHSHPYFNHGHGHHGRHGDHGEIPPEKITERLEILNGLSFPAENNAHYEELLKRFHGRIGAVVEAVIREQREKEPEGDEPEGDEGQASTSQPMQA